jgi:phage terminase small subunit
MDNGNGNGSESESAPRLTGKQRAFVDLWFENGFNATDAARRAGYSGACDRDFASAGSRTLRNAKVQEEINRRWAAHGMAAEEVAARLVEQARGTVGDFVDVVEPGRVAILNLEKAQQKHKLHLIKRLYWTKHGPRLELYDQQKALELIARSLGMFRDTVEHTGTVEVIIDI